MLMGNDGKRWEMLYTFEAVKIFVRILFATHQRNNSAFKKQAGLNYPGLLFHVRGRKLLCGHHSLWASPPIRGGVWETDGTNEDIWGHLEHF